MFTWKQGSLAERSYLKIVAPVVLAAFLFLFSWWLMTTESTDVSPHPTVAQEVEGESGPELTSPPPDDPRSHAPVDASSLPSEPVVVVKEHEGYQGVVLLGNGQPAFGRSREALTFREIFLLAITFTGLAGATQKPGWIAGRVALKLAA